MAKVYDQMAPPTAGKIAIVIDAKPPAKPWTRPCSPTLAALMINSCPPPAQDALLHPHGTFQHNVIKPRPQTCPTKRLFRTHPEIISTMRWAAKTGHSQTGLCASCPSKGKVNMHVVNSTAPNRNEFTTPSHLVRGGKKIGCQNISAIP